MHSKKTKFDFLNKTTLIIVAILLMILSAIILLWQGNKNSLQSVPATPARIYFAGKYCIGDGEPQDIVAGEHIPSTKGDVTLRGNFHMLTPSGEYIGVYSGNALIAFYTNHINLTFIQNGGQPYVIDHENPLFGASACGVDWTTHAFSKDPGVIEIVVHNPHNFGNENAIDEMLSNVAFWSGIDFEKDILESGETQRNTGLLFIIASLMLLGTALFSSLIHLKNSKVIWLFGLVGFFAGVYFTYSAPGISFWRESIVANTILLGSSMMFYAFLLCAILFFCYVHNALLSSPVLLCVPLLPLKNRR